MVELKKDLLELAAMCYLNDDYIKFIWKREDKDDLFVCKYGIFHLEEVEKKANEVLYYIR